MPSWADPRAFRLVKEDPLVFLAWWACGDSRAFRLVKEDPLVFLIEQAKIKGIKLSRIEELQAAAEQEVSNDFERAKAASAPALDTVTDFVLAQTTVTAEQGDRHPENAETIIMVDAALHAVDEILADHPEALLYGQDVGHRLGGVFREAATLAQKHGKHRVFNTPIQEAYIIGSTAGMSAVGCKPIVEVQFADYINQHLKQQ